MSDVRMHSLLAMRYTIAALDSQIEALMKAEAGVETSQCSHPVEARQDDPQAGMAEAWTCTACGYVYDERRAIDAELEEPDGR